MHKFRRASGMPDTKASVSSAFPRLNSGLGLDGDLADLALLFGFPLLDDLADLFGLRLLDDLADLFGLPRLGDLAGPGLPDQVGLQRLAALDGHLRFEPRDCGA